MGDAARGDRGRRRDARGSRCGALATQENTYYYLPTPMAGIAAMKINSVSRGHTAYRVMAR